MINFTATKLCPHISVSMSNYFLRITSEKRLLCQRARISGALLIHIVNCPSERFYVHFYQ